MLVFLVVLLVYVELFDDVYQCGVLCIVLEGIYLLFNFKQGGKFIGFEIELGELLVVELVVKLEFVIIEWSGIFVGLQSGKYDIVLNQVLVNEQWCKVFDFSELYIIFSVQLIVCVDEICQFKLLEDFKGFKFGVGQGINYVDLVKLVVGVNVCIYLGVLEYLQDLVSKCIDVVFNDCLLIFFVICEVKLLVKFGVVVGLVVNMVIFYWKNNLKFGEVLNVVLEKIKVDGCFVKFLEKWFGLDVSQLLK